MTAPEDHSLDNAIARLPHVRSGLKEGEWKFPRCWWRLWEALDREDGGPPLLSGDYSLDCFIGRTLGENLLLVCQRYPQHAGTLIQDTLRDMVAVGRFSGVEIGFLSVMGHYFGACFTARA